MNNNSSYRAIVFTGEGKGKTSAGLGIVCRALGAGKRVAFVQFIKSWQVSEDRFFDTIQPLFSDKLTTYKGGKGFYHAGDLSAKNVTDDEHIAAAAATYTIAKTYASSGDYDVVVCDEINNTTHDGLLTIEQLAALIQSVHVNTTLCLTGRYFPGTLFDQVNLISDIQKIKHPYDTGVVAKKGIDY